MLQFLGIKFMPAPIRDLSENDIPVTNDLIRTHHMLSELCQG